MWTVPFVLGTQHFRLDEHLQALGQCHVLIYNDEEKEELEELQRESDRRTETRYRVDTLSSTIRSLIALECLDGVIRSGASM